MVPPNMKEIIGSILPSIIEFVPMDIDMSQQTAIPLPVNTAGIILLSAVYMTFKVLKYMNAIWDISINIEL